MIDDQPTNNPEDYIPVPASPNTGIEGDEEKWRNDQRNNWDRQLKAQRRLNKITIVTGLIALGGLGVIYGTLKITQTQAEIAQRELELSERPWISISDAEATGPLTIDKMGNASTSVKIVVKNVGKTPARFYPHFELSDETKSEEVLSRQCHSDIMLKGQEGFPTMGTFGPILFPNDPHPMNLGVNGKPTLTTAPDTYLIIPRLVGCIVYKSVISEEIYYTGFIYVLQGYAANRFISSIQFRNDGSIVEAPPEKPEFDLKPFTKDGSLALPGVSLEEAFTGVIVK